MVDRVDDEVVAAGDIRRLSTTEGLDVWVIYTAGTVDSSQPSISISQIGDNIAVTDNTASFKIQGLQTAEGLYSSLALTNKITAVKANPVDTTNLTKAGDAASVLSVVDDSAELALVGLDAICSSGKVYKLDNTAGSGGAFVTITGNVDNTNKHSLQVFARSSGSDVSNLLRLNGGGSGSENIDSSGYVNYLVENDTPTSTTRRFEIRVTNGFSVYFILPGLYESPIAPPSPIIGDDTAAAQTMSETVTSTPIADTKLVGNDESIQVSFSPSIVGIEQWLFSDGTSGILLDASNNVNFTDGVNTATGTATIAADGVYTVLVEKSSTTGVTITTNGVVDAEESGQTDDITWGATIYTGSKGATLQLNGVTISARTL
jgi:hypothetical protein